MRKVVLKRLVKDRVMLGNTILWVATGEATFFIIINAWRKRCAPPSIAYLKSANT